MKIIKKHLTYSVAALIALSFSGCGVPVGEIQSQSVVPATTQGNLAAPTTPVAAASQSPSNKAQSQNVTVNIFYPDRNCERLVPEPVEVPQGKSLDAAVAKVLEKAVNGDFDLAGYRIEENKTSGEIAIDLRLSPDSRRQFASMTSCEQFAVFGSLRQTLTNNSQWTVKEVRFTEQGEEIFF